MPRFTERDEDGWTEYIGCFAQHPNGVITKARVENGDGIVVGIYAQISPGGDRWATTYIDKSKLGEYIQQGKVVLYRANPELEKAAQDQLRIQIIQDIEAQARAASTPKEAT